jgi:hypothetical protein
VCAPAAAGGGLTTKLLLDLVHHLSVWRRGVQLARPRGRQALLLPPLLLCRR